MSAPSLGNEGAAGAAESMRPDRERTPRAAAVDRRAFLGAAGAAAGALAAFAAAPFPARALGLHGPGAAADPRDAGSSPRGLRELASDDGWHIDDMWGHMPRYAHPIPHSPARSSPIDWEHVDPIDRALVI